MVFMLKCKLVSMWVLLLLIENTSAVALAPIKMKINFSVAYDVYVWNANWSVCECSCYLLNRSLVTFFTYLPFLLPLYYGFPVLL